MERDLGVRLFSGLPFDGLPGAITPLTAEADRGLKKINCINKPR